MSAGETMIDAIRAGVRDVNEQSADQYDAWIAARGGETSRAHWKARAERAEAENAVLRQERDRAANEMANVIVQADCLRHYAKMADGTKAGPLPTVGELQAGHFEDIAVRAFPGLASLLEEKRAARATARQEGER